MTRVTYIGGHDAVDLPEIGVENLARGESLEVDDTYADLLLEQPDNWTAGDPPAVPFDITTTDPDDEE